LAYATRGNDTKRVNGTLNYFPESRSVDGACAATCQSYVQCDPKNSTPLSNYQQVILKRIADCQWH